MSTFIDSIPPPFGRPTKYATAKSLWEKFLDYVAWADANPIETFNRVSGRGDTKTQKSQEIAHNRVQRPYTLCAFMTFAGISNWTEFKKKQNQQKPDFVRVIHAIENATKSQQIDGAMVGLYNPNLTARLNGIAEATEVAIKTDKFSDMTDEELQEEIKRIYESTQNP